MLISENLDNFLKPKSKKEIKHKLNSLDVDDKENLVKSLTFSESYFANSEEAIEFIEDLLPKEEKEKVWQTIIDLVDSSGYSEEFFGSDEINKETILDNMTYYDILDLMITSLSEDYLDLIIKNICSI